MTSQGVGTTVLCYAAIRFSQFYLSKAVITQPISIKVPSVKISPVNYVPTMSLET